MIVFGGIDETKRLNDLWKYDIGTRELVVVLLCARFRSSTAVEQRTISGSRPSPRAQASRRLPCPIPLPYCHPQPSGRHLIGSDYSPLSIDCLCAVVRVRVRVRWL
jgi:hypothetical protein